MSKKNKFRPTAPYTVVGFYVDNNQPWVRHERAQSPEEAAKKSLEWTERETSGDARVVSVFRGHLSDQLSNETLLIISDGVVSEIGG